MEVEVRKEEEIYVELESLCKSPGYLHAIAYFCFRDNTIKYDEQLEAENVANLFSHERLIRTEISTLIGLACKSVLDIGLPLPGVLQGYITRTEVLLEELHKSMLSNFYKKFNISDIADEKINPLSDGDLIRESIFYSGESAYNFQYRDLALDKYKNDNDWFVKNKGYSIEQALAMLSAINSIQSKKITEYINELPNIEPDEWTFLPSFMFDILEVENESGVNCEIVRLFVESFVVPQDVSMGVFAALDDFNPLNAYPVIKMGDEKYINFQIYSLVEAFYETPFFWFMNDNAYKDIAIRNRGAYAEEFSEGRLKKIFGERRVFSNIDIYKDKKTRVGEIDVLVVFGDRAIVLQAKSKRLTIESRKGNDNSLKEDFKLAVQDSYNQAYLCAMCLNDNDYKLYDSSGGLIIIPREYKEIYPISLVSDHYPSLTYQASQFLVKQEGGVIMPPYVMDIFFLDVLTEFLSSPLYLLSYLNRRVNYGDSVSSPNELTILSYHLKQNLWVDRKYAAIQLDESVCADLDVAMMVRREGRPGKDVPDGILTKFNDSYFSRVVSEISNQDDPGIIDFGFMLLQLSSDAVEQLNAGISKLIEMFKIDGKNHDLTLAISDEETGLTIHCNNDPVHNSGARLEEHCLRRKYTEKAKSWFGLCISPFGSLLRFGVAFDFVWTQSDYFDQLTKGMPKAQKLTSNNKINFTTKVKAGRKIGRNEKCPCGSGKKYKKCCLK